ncbi:MAG: acetolactate decarboxylase [Treponema sp.]
MKKLLFLLFLITIPSATVSIAAQNSALSDETLTQVSTIQALTAGDYEGVMTVGSLLSYGDTGLGTFDNLNGEMIVLDGVCYQAESDGKVIKAGADVTVPFACVTKFNSDFTETFENVPDITALKNRLSAEIGKYSGNTFYVCRIEGTFNKVYVRSEYAQKKPFRTLDQVMKTDQTEFTYNSIAGTLVCVYCPAYAAGINAAGWHIHFISADKTKGGHVLDISFASAKASFDKTDNFTMILPDTESFNSLNLTEVSKEAVRKVEQGQ